jgi:beta-lactamase regulating signal transducer with metallopeptidase domain
MGAAIVVVFLLRRPLRASFGAPVAYALWLLVPVACLASLLPPRTYAPPPAYVMPLQNPAAQNPAAQMPATMPMAQPAPRIPEQLTAHIAPPMISAKTASLDSAFPDYAALLFAVWTLGTVLMALYLARLQVRFHATMRLGEAGPAVLGFFRPRLVMPDTFEEQFTVAEQAAILAHERVHLARQDARINALAALLRCLCWFNPLIHLGAASMRIDQELACDATALAGAVSRRDYAKALLKSQMMVTLLPLGCNWPGSQHPLIERIALLKRKRPGRARRIAGTGLILFVATCAGLGAWAAQTPVPAKFIAAPHQNKQVALATPPVVNLAPGQNTGDNDGRNAGPSQPVAEANPTGSGSPVDTSKNVRADKTISAAPSAALPQPLPNDTSTTAMASSAPPAPQSASPATAVALNDKPAMQPATPDSSAGPIPAAAPASPGSATGLEPRLITEGALGCLIGLAPDGCEAVFEYPSVERRTITHCAAEYVHGWLDNCPNAGALETVEFLGTNAAGADVYAVKYLSMTSTYILPPPGPDGKIATHCTFGRPPASAFQGACTDGAHCPARCFSNVDSSVAKVTTTPISTSIPRCRPIVSRKPPSPAFTTR